MKVSDESKVGIFVVVSLTILILGYNFLKGKDIFTKRDTYYAYYTHIDGLTVSSPVLINGYRIGKVSKIKLMSADKNLSRILVEFSVKDDLKVPVNSIARIINSDLLGSKAIDILLSKETKFCTSRDTLIGETAQSMAATIDNYVTPITEKINNVMTGIEAIFDEKARLDLQQTLSGIKVVTNNIADMTSEFKRDQIILKVDEISNNIEGITKIINDNKGNITEFFNDMNSFSDTLKAMRLAETVEESYKTIGQIKTIAEKINAGEGSIGLLVNNDELLKNLQVSSANLKAILTELNEQPGKYIRRAIKKPKKEN